MEALAAALFGAIIGSFLNVVIYRLPRGESLSTPRSRCPSCATTLGARENVPILSWLFLRGKCRHCGASISPRYPLIELLTALSFGAIVLADGVHEELALELPFAAVLIAVAFIDLDHKIIPNKILLPAAVFGVAAVAAVRLDALPESLIGAAGAFLFLLIAALAYPAGMGMGDVKLAGVMGLYLGAAVAPALLMAFLAGSVVGIAIIVREGAAARKKALPFGPFLALGGLVATVFGSQIVEAYSDRFL